MLPWERGGESWNYSRRRRDSCGLDDETVCAVCERKIGIVWSTSVHSCAVVAPAKTFRLLHRRLRRLPPCAAAHAASSPRASFLFYLPPYAEALSRRGPSPSQVRISKWTIARSPSARRVILFAPSPPCRAAQRRPRARTSRRSPRIRRARRLALAAAWRRRPSSGQSTPPRMPPSRVVGCPTPRCRVRRAFGRSRSRRRSRIRRCPMQRASERRGAASPRLEATRCLKPSFAALAAHAAALLPSSFNWQLRLRRRRATPRGGEPTAVEGRRYVFHLFRSDVLLWRAAPSQLALHARSCVASVAPRRRRNRRPACGGVARDFGRDPGGANTTHRLLRRFRRRARRHGRLGRRACTSLRRGRR